MHLKNMVRLIEQGETVRSALGALKGWVKVESVTALTIALQVADERGGKLSEVLDRIAHTADEIARCERKREANVASGRMMVAIMAAFPFGFLGFVWLMWGEIVEPMFNTFAGQTVLAIVIVLIYLSIRWAAKILAPKV
jgi:Flp pilus assembly protein TadB